MEGKLLIYKCCSYCSLFMIGVGLGRLELLTNNPQLNWCFHGISSVYREPSCSLIFSDNLPLVKQIIYNVLESTRIIGLLLLPLLPELSAKINEQLGSIYSEEIPWKKQLSWGLLENNSSLPKPTPIINKLEYEQHL